MNTVAESQYLAHVMISIWCGCIGGSRSDFLVVKKHSAGLLDLWVTREVITNRAAIMSDLGTMYSVLVGFGLRNQRTSKRAAPTTPIEAMTTGPPKAAPTTPIEAMTTGPPKAPKDWRAANELPAATLPFQLERQRHRNQRLCPTRWNQQPWDRRQYQQRQGQKEYRSWWEMMPLRLKILCIYFCVVSSECAAEELEWVLWRSTIDFVVLKISIPVGCSTIYKSSLGRVHWQVAWALC